MLKQSIIAFFVFIPLMVLSQIDTTSLSYYPLNDGDYWEYVEEASDFSISSPFLWRKYFSQEVIGDTIFSGCGKFKIIQKTLLDTSQFTTYIYERVDTASCNVFRYDAYRDTVFLIDSLKAIYGDSCNAGRFGYDFEVYKTYCTEFITDTILSIPVLSKDFNEPKILFYSEHRLTSGLGLTQSNVYPCFMSFITQLVYARINGVEYGEQVNSIADDKNIKPNDFYLYQNYPNPFNPTTNIQFSIPKSEYVTLKIFNLQGREISTLVSSKLKAGEHSYTWKASKYASGVYIIVLQGKNQSQIKKCLLIK